MALGPIEVVVVEFPGNNFTGAIIPELQRLIDSDVISIVDGLLVTKDDDGDTTFVELSEVGANEDASALAGLLDHVEGLLAEDDVESLTESLAPNSSAAILVFEHTWMKPIRDAVVASGGVLAESYRIPGAVVEEVLAIAAETD